MQHHKSQAQTNPQGQLTTIDQAVTFAVMARLAGVAIEPIDDTDGYHNSNSGVYLPPWGGSDPGQQEPGQGTYRQFLLRLSQKKNDGSHVEGFNIGLLLALAIGHTAPPATPNAPANPVNYQYAIDDLKKEAAAQLESANQETA